MKIRGGNYLLDQQRNYATLPLIIYHPNTPTKRQIISFRVKTRRAQRRLSSHCFSITPQFIIQEGRDIFDINHA